MILWVAVDSLEMLSERWVFNSDSGLFLGCVKSPELRH